MPIKNDEKRRAYMRKYMKKYMPEYRRQEKRLARLGLAVLHGNEITEEARRDLKDLRFGRRSRRKRVKHG